jgi:hypothetical protein
MRALSTDSDFEFVASSSSEEEDKIVSEGDEEEEEDLCGDEEEKKPNFTRLLLEYDSLKKCMEKNCQCPEECNGEVEMQVKTICLTSSVMLCCKD